MTTSDCVRIACLGLMVAYGLCAYALGGMLAGPCRPRGDGRRIPRRLHVSGAIGHHALVPITRRHARPPSRSRDVDTPHPADLTTAGWLLGGVLALCTTAVGAAMTFAFVTWPKMAKEDAEARREDRHALVNALQAVAGQAVERHQEAMHAHAAEAARSVERHHQTMDLLARVVEAQACIAEVLAGPVRARRHQFGTNHPFGPFAEDGR
jgi:hypothetical protein